MLSLMIHQPSKRTNAWVSRLISRWYLWIFQYPKYTLSYHRYQVSSRSIDAYKLDRLFFSNNKAYLICSWMKLYHVNSSWRRLCWHLTGRIFILVYFPNFDLKEAEVNDLIYKGLVFVLPNHLLHLLLIKSHQIQKSTNLIGMLHVREIHEHCWNTLFLACQVARGQ